MTATICPSSLINMRSKIFFFIILFFVFASPVALAQIKVDNAGFVPGNIWYSKDPFFASDSIEIHTIV